MSDETALKAQLALVRQQFEVVLGDIRPELHRYCTRMVGSPLDGEDLVQDTLAKALFALATRRSEVDVRWRPWLFRIAHNRCVDFLRARRLPTQPIDDEAFAMSSDDTPADEQIALQQLSGRALELLVMTLPPRERAAVLLKDVMDHSLKEIAEVMACSVGAAKAALHRGRQKLAEVRSQGPGLERVVQVRHEALTQRYVERFERRDWVGVSALLREDVGIEVVDRFHGRGRAHVEDNYLTTYGRWPWLTFEMVVVHGEALMVSWYRDGQGRAQPYSACRLAWDEEGQVMAIRDYAHVEYALEMFADALRAASSLNPRELKERTS